MYPIAAFTMNSRNAEFMMIRYAIHDVRHTARPGHTGVIRQQDPTLSSCRMTPSVKWLFTPLKPELVSMHPMSVRQHGRTSTFKSLGLRYRKKPNESPHQYLLSEGHVGQQSARWRGWSPTARLEILRVFCGSDFTGKGISARTP
jgi:hypothetical protein